MPTGIPTSERPASTRIERQPGTGQGSGIDPSTPGATREKSRSYPSRHIAAPTVGSTAPSLSTAARRATASIVSRPAETGTAGSLRAASLRALSSESGRNRLAI